MDKYTVPNLPTIQHVLEDISNPEIINSDAPLKTGFEDETLQQYYTCFQHCEQLKTDLKKQNDLSAKLKELNQKLLDNIESMKKQTE